MIAFIRLLGFYFMASLLPPAEGRAVRPELVDSSTFVQPFPMAQCHGLALEDASIDIIQRWLSSGKLTSVELVGCFLERINQVDGHVG